MNVKSTALVALGITLGIVLVSTVAACAPDPVPAPVAAVADPVQNLNNSDFNPADPEANPESYLDYVTIGSMNAALTTPCELEDSENCYWDASSSGNGEGESFVDIHGIAYYEGQLPVWHNFTRGDVIVCDDGDVETDEYPAGQDAAMPHGGTWAHCS